MTSIEILADMECSDCRSTQLLSHVLEYDPSVGAPRYSETFKCGRCGVEWRNEGVPVPADIRAAFERAHGRWRVQLVSPGEPPPALAQLLVERAADRLLKPEAEQLADEIRRGGGDAEIVAEPMPPNV
ncbi:MAG TPA: hypothetical protein VM261_00330 [Kofleriaceae bacterium]|nr:hypothetical protein [Kofleriaceae bacterium]